jgi:hypothetical protein
VVGVTVSVRRWSVRAAMGVLLCTAFIAVAGVRASAPITSDGAQRIDRVHLDADRALAVVETIGAPARHASAPLPEAVGAFTVAAFALAAVCGVVVPPRGGRPRRDRSSTGGQRAPPASGPA